MRHSAFLGVGPVCALTQPGNKKFIGREKMGVMTYQNLVQRYGQNMAFDLLLTIEKMAKIRDHIAVTDEEARLKRALDILDRDEAAA